MARQLLFIRQESDMLQRWFFAVTAVWLGVGVFTAGQQDRATVQLRDGSKVEGRIDGTDPEGELVVRVSQNDERRLPLGSVALIDKVGGASGLPDTEVREAVGPQHLLLLTNGSSVKGRLIAIRGGEGSANEDQPRTYVLQSSDGGQRSYGPDQVARVYLGSYPFAASSNSNPSGTNNASDLATGNYTPGAIRVPASAGWVNTGMRVRKGEFVSFDTTGEVQLSESRSDRAQSAGTTRTAPRAPLPNANAGALIGRVGNSQAFGIGNQTSVPMPFDGILYLAVNDDERSDNAGEFVVSIRRGR
jgi:hypothetical protein